MSNTATATTEPRPFPAVQATSRQPMSQTLKGLFPFKLLQPLRSLDPDDPPIMPLMEAQRARGLLRAVRLHKLRLDSRPRKRSNCGPTTSVPTGYTRRYFRPTLIYWSVKMERAGPQSPVRLGLEPSTITPLTGDSQASLPDTSNWRATIRVVFPRPKERNFTTFFSRRCKLITQLNPKRQFS